MLEKFMPKVVKTAVAAVIKKDSKIYLTKRSLLKIAEGNKWCLPGGLIEFKETAEQALKRELKEETGLDIKEMKFLSYFDEIMPKLNSHSMVLVFLVTISGKEKFNWEVSDSRWFGKDEIENIDMAFQHKDILRKLFKKK